MVQIRRLTPSLLDRSVETAIDSLKSEETRRAYHRNLDLFAKWLRWNRIPPINYSLVIRYQEILAKKGDKSVSVRTQSLASIKILCEILHADGLLNLYDLTLIRGIKPEKHESELKGKFIPEGDVKGLIIACQRDISPAGFRDASIIALLHSTGMRRGECADLEIDDINPMERRLVLKQTKNKKDRPAFINEGAFQHLRKWLRVRGVSPGKIYWRTKKGGELKRGVSITPQSIYYILKKRCREAGIETCSPHDFRRTLISNLLNQDTDLPLISRLVGHSGPDVTARYDRRPEEDLRRAASKIYTPY